MTIELVRTIVQVYEWNAGDGIVRRYRIDLALDLIQALSLRAWPLITPEKAREALLYNNRVSELLPENIAAADLSKPIIIMQHDTPEGPRAIIIDGWHRICKAVRTNHPEPLLCYVLTQDMAEACRVE